MKKAGLIFGALLVCLTSVMLVLSATASEKSAVDDESVKTAIFAGGCFWCSESDFEKLDGVISVISGYTGGKEKDPTYIQVSAGLIFGALLVCLTSVMLVLSATASEKSAVDDESVKTAIFAGGCFWCSESDFEKLDGVISVISGYTGGKEKDPTYIQVSAGRTSHTEGVEVRYDPEKISYSELVEFFWRTIDPTQVNGQFCDKGKQYRTAIYYQNDAEKNILEQSLATLNESKPFEEPIVTEIAAASKFYPAEEYHQDYYKRNEYRYKFYRWSCGRDQRIEELWGKQQG